MVQAAEKTLPAPHEMAVDFSKSCGVLRPLHGVNNGPVTPRGIPDLTPFFKEAAIPSCRLHDGPWSGAPVVDIPLIFPLAHADIDDPNNYLFARTDDYIKGITAINAQIIYRLGTSIEPVQWKYDTRPPKDFDRWAAVCVNIIRHYNEGWAGGFRHNIRYWEIWNEADNPAMWSGTPEQYFQLYTVAARAIKRHDPTLKVGGPAVSGGKEAFVDQFLNHCRDQQAPLDFFSWHNYSAQPAAIKKKAELIRQTLDRHGFQQAESHLNEWHYFNGNWKRLREDPVYRKNLFEEINGPAGAAFAAATLLLLQDTSVTVANYYAGDTLPFGLFDRFGIPWKTYFAFKAFGQLLNTPQRVTCTGGNEDQGLVIGAGLDGDRKTAQILLANFKSPSTRFRIQLQNLPWKDLPQVEVFAVDASKSLESIAKKRLDGPGAALEVDCPAPAVLLIRLTP